MAIGRIRQRAALGSAIASLILASCASEPPPASVAARPAPVEAGPAAPLGQILGGRAARTAALSGTGIVAIPGAAASGYMDRQERDLRARLAGSGIDVARSGTEIVLRLASGITFDFNAATIRPGLRPALDRITQVLVAYPASFVDVSGYTDATGTDAVNQRLSEQRAASVADYLAYQGVARARIAARGFGKQSPIGSNDTDAGRAENRRVDIKLSPVTEQDWRAIGRVPPQG